MKNNAVVQRRKCLAVPVIFIVIVAVYIYFSNTSIRSNLQEPGTDAWVPYTFGRPRDQQWFGQTCLKGMMIGALEELPTVIDRWKLSTNDQCRALYVTFTKILKMKYEQGKVVLPAEFKTKVRNWLGNKEEVFKQIYDQRIIMIRNQYTQEENTFNPLRSKRPLSVPEKPERQYVDELSNQTSQSCDFCKYQQYTAMDELGRIDNTHSFSAANTFKLDHWHALLMLKTHHPLNWSKEQFLDLMKTKAQWFSQVYKHSGVYKYPSGIMDLLPHAGASQVHPHVHAFLDRDNYPGTIELWRQAAANYNKDSPHHNYFTDLVELHSILGLTVTYGSSVAFANIVPKKDNEMVIISEKADADFFLLWYFVIRGFLDDMGSGTLCYSSGIAFPSMSGDTSEHSLPAYVRIVTRGAVADVRTDMSSLELFGSPNANTDPYRVIGFMRKSVEKRG